MPIRELGVAIYRVIRGRLYIKFSLGLVTIGAFLLIPSWREHLLLPIVAAIVKRLVGEDINVAAPDPWIGPIMGATLVAFGIYLFFAFYRRERERDDQIQENAVQPYVTVVLGRNYIERLDEEEDLKDPPYRFKIVFDVHAGSTDLIVKEVEVSRWVMGCQCWVSAGLLTVDNGKPPFKTNLGKTDFNGSYPTIKPSAAIRFQLNSKARGPCPGFSADELEVCEYEVAVKVAFRNSSSTPVVTTIRAFAKQAWGRWDCIQKISPVPFMSDHQLLKLLSQGSIEQSDYDKVIKIDERTRFLVTRFGSDNYQLDEKQLLAKDSLMRCREAIEKNHL